MTTIYIFYIFIYFQIAICQLANHTVWSMHGIQYRQIEFAHRFDWLGELLINFIRIQLGAFALRLGKPGKHKDCKRKQRR